MTIQPMTIQRFESGPRMSQAVVHGKTIYLAGQVAEATAGSPVLSQTQEILSRIDRLLEAAGGDRTRILQATIHLADITTFAEMNAAWDAWVTPGHLPARATVEAWSYAPEHRVVVAAAKATR